jgi:cytochrome c553
MKASNKIILACIGIAFSASLPAAEHASAAQSAAEQPAAQQPGTTQQPAAGQQQPPTPQAQPAAAQAAAAQAAAQPKPAGNADAGRQKASMCVGCHNIPGYKTAFPVVYSVPKLDGQHANYIVSALRAYKAGNRQHPSMRAVAASLSDQDMADLAAFYSSGPAQSASR